MTIIFYRTLLKGVKNLTADEKILYSFLVSKSITDYGEFFDRDGQCLNREILVDFIGNSYNLKIKEINNTQVAKALCISRQSVINLKQTLFNKGFIRYDDNDNLCLFVSNVLFKYGYFELVGREKLKGELLIFYSYLLQKSKRYRYCIDTYKCKLAEELGKTTTAITKLLNRLYKLDLAKRLDNGKLKIYHFKTNNNETN